MASSTSPHLRGCEFVTPNARESAEARRFPQACGASLLLHGALIGLLVAMMWTTRRAVEDPSPFLVVQTTAADTGLPRSTDFAQSGAGEKTRAQTDALFTPPPSVRTWVPPTPVAAVDELEATPKETAMPTALRTNYREFQEQHPVRGGPAVAPAAKPGPLAGPRIVAPKITPGAGTDGDHAASISGVQGDAQTAYFSDLLRRLRDAHEKPAGLSDLLSAEASFTLAANGMVSDVRIVRSSGSEEFDRSVRNSVARVRMPKRPDGRTDVRTVTFRMREG